MTTHRTSAGFASRAMRVSALALAGTLVAGTGCRPAPEIGAEIPGGGGGGSATTFTEIRTLILEPRCATSACHQGANPVASPRLDGPEAFDAIVDVPSLASSLLLVAPGDPDASYLLHTIVGTAADVGGSSSDMPLDDLPLDESEIEAIRAWIAAGAQND